MDFTLFTLFLRYLIFFLLLWFFALDEVKNIPSILLRNVFLYYEIYKLDQGA